MEALSVLSVVIALLTLVYTAATYNDAKRGRRQRQREAMEAARRQRRDTVSWHLIERILSTLSEIERFIHPVVAHKELLTSTVMARMQDAGLPVRIDVEEAALVRKQLIEPVGVAAYLETLLSVSFPPVQHETLEELGLVAVRQAFAARDLLDAVERLRREIGG